MLAMNGLNYKSLNKPRMPIANRTAVSEKYRVLNGRVHKHMYMYNSNIR